MAFRFCPINQREQFLGRFAVALIDTFEDPGDIAHATEFKTEAGMEGSAKSGGSFARGESWDSSPNNNKREVFTNKRRAEMLETHGKLLPKLD